MDNCDEKYRLLFAYLDGELSEDEKTKFEQELSRDPELRKEYEQFQKVDFLYASLSHKLAPAHLEKSVRATLKKSSSTRIRFRRTIHRPKPLWPALAAAAILMVGLLATFYQIGIQKQESTFQSTIAKNMTSPFRDSQTVMEVSKVTDSSKYQHQSLSPDSPMIFEITPQAKRLAKNEENLNQLKGQNLPAQPSPSTDLREEPTSHENKEDHSPQIPKTAGQIYQVQSSTVSPAPAKMYITSTKTEEETTTSSQEAAGPKTRKDEFNRRQTSDGKVFLLINNVWQEQNYAGQKYELLTRNSNNFENLAKIYPILEEISTWNEEVIFFLDGVWYKLILEN